MTVKAALREAQRARVLEPAERSRQSEALKARLLSMDIVVHAKAVALFVGVRHEPLARYNQEIHDELGQTVWASGCKSWNLKSTCYMSRSVSGAGSSRRWRKASASTT